MLSKGNKRSNPKIFFKLILLVTIEIRVHIRQVMVNLNYRCL
jgi:hypothetical protein